MTFSEVRRKADVSAAVAYINESFPNPTGSPIVSADGLIESVPGYVTFRVKPEVFVSKDRDTLGHLFDLVKARHGDDYKRMCSSDTEDYVWNIGVERYIRVCHYERTGTFIQLVDIGE